MSGLAFIVDAHLRACLPPGVPPSYARITRARKIGTGRSAEIIAELIMFDGFEGRVSLRQHGPELWSYRFFHLPEGDISFEDGRWIRIPRQEELSLPATPTPEPK